MVLLSIDSLILPEFKVPLIKVNNDDWILKFYLLFSAVIFNFRPTADVDVSRAEILKGE